MTCHGADARLSAYLDRELTGEEALELREHLRSCPRCQEELEVLRLIKQSLAKTACCEPSEEFEQRLMQQVLTQPRRSRQPWATYGLAMVLAVALGTVLWKQNQGSPVATPRSIAMEEPSLSMVGDPLSGGIPVSTVSYSK